MLQRVQTLYWILAGICISFLNFGVTIFEFHSSKSDIIFSLFKIETIDKVTSTSEKSNQYFYFFTILIFVLIVLAISSFKKIKKQMKLGRIVFFLYLLEVVFLLLVSSFPKIFIGVEASSKSLGIGFFIAVVGLPFTFLANLGVKRDKNLLDSLDRLR